MRTPALLILFLSIACIEAPISDKEIESSAVINGQKITSTSPLARPTVMLEGKSGAICSGTIISPNVIITAAHCLKNALPTHAISAQALSFHKSFKVAKSISHPDFKGVGNDLALVFLAEPVDKEIAPMKIYDGHFLTHGLPIHVGGFSGFSKAQKRDVFDYLDDKDIGTYAVTNHTSSGPYFLTRNVMIEENKDRKWKEDRQLFGFRQMTGGICPGDSGGPTMLKIDEEFHLIGVNKAISTKKVIGPDNKRVVVFDCEEEGYSTHLALFRTWIEDTIHQNMAEPATFVSSGFEMSADDLTCSLHIEERLAFAKRLFRSSIFDCPVPDEIIQHRLETFRDQCVISCGEIPGLADHCEFFSKGEVRILEKARRKCASNHLKSITHF